MKLIWNWVSLKIRKIEPFLIPFIIFVLLAIVIPAVLLTTYSFQAIGSPELKRRLTSNIFGSLLLSFFVSTCALALTLCISFPLAVLVWFACSNKAKKRIFLLLAFPLLSNYFIKLIGLKSVFDFFNGSLNSTCGIGYTIVGLTYLALPLVTYNFINTLSTLPKSKNWAVKDLGYTFWGELFFLILPWSKTAICSSSILFFLPSLFTTFISEFLNHSSGTQMIGEIIANISSIAISSEGSKPFVAFLASFLFTIVVFFLVFGALIIKASKNVLVWFREKIALNKAKKLRQLTKINIIFPKRVGMGNI